MKRREFNKMAAAGFIGIGLSTGGRAGNNPLANEVLSSKVGQRHLFLDDRVIESMHHLQRTMHQPEKWGAVIRSPDPTKGIQARTAPVWDREAKVYKLWTRDNRFWHSPDGLHWIPGPKTNLLSRWNFHGVYDPNDPDPERRFKALLLDEGLAVSPDGIQWTKLDTAKIPSSDEGNLSFDPDENLFIHTVKRGARFGRAVAIATSRDFENWTDYGVVFQSDETDQELGRRHIEARISDRTLQQTFYNDPDSYNVDVYNMGAFLYEGIYIGMPAMYHATGPMPNYPNTAGFQLVQLACSRDLKTWLRLGERMPFIGPSRLESGAYDLTQILPPSAPVLNDDQLWFYYTGLKYRANFTYIGTYPHGKYVPKPGKDRNTGAICLAVLRRDGFISVDSGGEQGILLTKPLLLNGTQLHVNVDAAAGGLDVTMQDGNGREIAVSEPVTGDITKGTVKWKSGNLESHRGQPIRLRFKLRNARFYSFWLTE